MLIYFSINIESSTCLSSLLVFRSSVRSFHSVWFTCSSPKKGEKKQASVVLTRSVSGKGTAIAIKHSAQGLSVAPNHVLQKVMAIFPQDFPFLLFCVSCFLWEQNNLHRL